MRAARQDSLFSVHSIQNPAPGPLRSIFRETGNDTLVVSKFSGWGTLLEVAPLLSALRLLYPRTRLILVTERRNAEIASRIPGPDDILFLPGDVNAGPVSPSGLLQLAARIRRLHPTLFLDLQLHTRRRAALFLSLASSSRIRIGFVGRHGGLRMRFLTHPLYFNSHHPSRMAYEQAGLLLGIPPERLSHSLAGWTLRESPEDLHELEKIFPAIRMAGKICVVNPNASERGTERRWPAERFSEAAGRLLARHPSLGIVLTGSRDEHPYTEGVARGIPRPWRPRVTNLAGRLSLGGLHALLNHAHVFLTNDSGPLHLAIHSATPTVGLFGPTRPDLVLPDIDRRRLTVLYDAHYCSPCLYHVQRPPCGGENVCMSSLSVERVVRAVETMLQGTVLPEAREGLFSCPPKTLDSVGNPLAGFRGKERPAP